MTANTFLGTLVPGPFCITGRISKRGKADILRMDWLARITLPYIVAAVTVLFGLRLALGRYKSPAAKSATETVESALIAVVLVFLVIRPFIVQAFYIPTGSMEPTLLGHDYPTPVHDHILVNKFVYRFHDPRHGDIVVFKAPPGASLDGQEPDFIKRLIGLPGDTIRVTRGYMVINGIRYSHLELRTLLSSDASPDSVTIKLRKNGVILNGRLLTVAQFAEKLGQQDAKGMRLVPGEVYRNGKPLVEPYTREDPDYDMPPVKVPAGHLFMMGDNRNNSQDSHVWGTLDRNRVIGKAWFRFWPLNRLGLPK